MSFNSFYIQRSYIRVNSIRVRRLLAYLLSFKRAIFAAVIFVFLHNVVFGRLPHFLYSGLNGTRTIKLRARGGGGEKLFCLTFLPTAISASISSQLISSHGSHYFCSDYILLRSTGSDSYLISFLFRFNLCIFITRSESVWGVTSKGHQPPVVFSTKFQG